MRKLSMLKKNKIKAKEFEVGQLIFAKLRGYPAWPAKITERNKQIYIVCFFGTADIAKMNGKHIYAYEENKKKFVTAKNLKRSSFKEAVNQIESELQEKGNVASTSVVIQAADENRNLKRKTNSVDDNVDNSISQPAKKRVCSKKEDTSVPVVGSKSAEVAKKSEASNLILACVKPNSYVGINVDYKKPKTFPSHKIRHRWEAAALKRAEELKFKLEKKLIDIKSVLQQVVMTPPPELVIEESVRRFIDKISPRQKALYCLLFKFFKKRRLREILGVETIMNNNEFGIDWKKFKEHERISLMLFQQTRVRGHIRLARTFAAELKPFITNYSHAHLPPAAQKIREEAVEMYKILLPMFKHKDLNADWDRFCRKVRTFRQSLVDMDEAQFQRLTANAYLKILAER